MADVLIDSDQVIGEWDPLGRSWSARDWTPGPAGTAGLVLPGGVELDIDVASPAAFVGLYVEPGTADARVSPVGLRALRRLLGADRAGELLGLATGPGQPVRLGAPRPDAARATGAFGTPRGRGRGVAPGLARVALATAAATRPGASAAIQALARLDAAIAAASIGPGVGFGGRARRDAAVAATLLLDVARRGELDNQPVDPDDLGQALLELLPLLADELTAPVRALRADIAARRLRLRQAGADDEAAAEQYHRQAAAAMASPMAAGAPTPRRAAARLLPVDRRSLPLALAAEVIAARATTPSEAELRFPGRASLAEGWWARAFGADDVILAAAPLLPVGEDAVARLLVPPAELLGIEIDVTNQPGEPRQGSRARRVIEAVASGEAAARADRLEQGAPTTEPERARERGDRYRPVIAATDDRTELQTRRTEPFDRMLNFPSRTTDPARKRGRSGRAGERWGRCAALWKAADAGKKAGLASEFAQGRSAPGRVPLPLLADALVEELEG